MAFDFKKEYREFYLPKNQPSFIDVPAINYLAVRGQGNPNEEGSEYKQSIALLYAIAYTLKMSGRGAHRMEGFFDYVVPPLEGFWWTDGGREVDFRRKELFRFLSVIRLPDFVTRAEFDWAICEATEKKQQDFSKVEFFSYTEGMCVQCMHVGPYDEEPATIARMDAFARERGWENDLTEQRLHHEIYLSDARRCAPEKLRTVIRHPVAPLK